MMDQITADPTTWPSGNKVWDVCRAIALAEGANVAGDAPDRYNNPGDLSKGDEHGMSVSGYTTLPDGEREIIFVSKYDGWTALYIKISHIVQGKSSIFPKECTWEFLASKYAGNSQVWLDNVTRVLAVDPKSRIIDYVIVSPSS